MKFTLRVSGLKLQELQTDADQQFVIHNGVNKYSAIAIDQRPSCYTHTAMAMEYTLHAFGWF